MAAADQRSGRRLRGAVAAFLLLAALAGCADDDNGDEAPFARDAAGDAIPPPPTSPNGPLTAPVARTVEQVMSNATTFGVDRPAVVELGQAGDARLAWLLVDLMRIFQGEDDTGFLVDAFAELTGQRIESRPAFREAADLLIAWDVPAPPGYVANKAILYEALEEAWDPFFEDGGATVDWRHVTWGGVFADTRSRAEAAAGERCPRGCIPALDDPAVTEADEGYWLPPERPVFGVIVDGEARAYPVHVLEAHELVNDSLGGRRIGLVFCTLCRSAQAFLLDDVPDDVGAGIGTGPLVLRTSGLLQRSNKLSYELRTRSLVESFTGRALSGPLREAGVVLEQVPVVTSSWGAWRTEHRDTTILARDGGIGRVYDLDPLGDRDADGPIFPVGDVDPRLPAQELVVGALTADGSTVAFPVAAARLELEAGRPVEHDGLHVLTNGDGLQVVTGSGRQVLSHQAFWFAWSQFHPDTDLWLPE